MESAFRNQWSEHRAARNTRSLASGGNAIGPLDPKISAPRTYFRQSGELNRGGLRAVPSTCRGWSGGALIACAQRPNCCYRGHVTAKEKACGWRWARAAGA